MIHGHIHAFPHNLSINTQAFQTLPSFLTEKQKGIIFGFQTKDSVISIPKSL